MVGYVYIIHRTLPGRQLLPTVDKDLFLKNCVLSDLAFQSYVLYFEDLAWNGVLELKSTSKMLGSPNKNVRTVEFCWRHVFAGQ